jgi:glycosyltransferase involved in cell wall biosynthesis
MRIGVDAHMLGLNETGNETYVFELLRALASLTLDDRILVYVERPEALPAEFKHAPHISIVPYRTKSGTRRLLLELPRLAARDRLDVLHISYNAPLHLPVHCALVVTVHDISFEHFPRFFSRRLRAFLRTSVPRSVRAAQHVITDTENAKWDIVKTYRLSPDKITVTHYAAGAHFRVINDAAQLRAIRAKYKTGDRFVLAVGNLQPRKNWERLIRAFARAAGDGALPHKLVMVGQRHWQNAPILEAAGRLGEQVVITGYVSPDDLLLLYNAAEVFAFPSLYEGFGLPVLEAMACGTPVITSNVSSLPEIAGDAALLVDPYREQQIAEALARMMQDEGFRAELGARGLARAREFSWDRTARQTLEVYHTAAINKRSSRQAHLAHDPFRQ